MKVMKTMSKILYLFAAIGVKKGIQIGCKIILKKTKSISLNNIAYTFKLRSGTSDIFTFYQMFIFKAYDIQLDFNPEIIIDAGANIGLAAIYFANKYPEAKIISIEPEQSNFNLLNENTKHYNNITTINKALSNVSNQVLNVVDHGYGNWGFMTESLDNLESENTDTLIKSITIDDIMNKYNIKTLDIVKIDIEGYEKEVFEANTEKWLPNTKCIIIELHDRLKAGCSKSFFSAISKYDFSFFYKDENLVFINNDKKVYTTKKD